MIIPVRCFTCNRLLADKWLFYERKCREIDAEATKANGGSGAGAGAGAAAGAAAGADHLSPRGKLLDDLGLKSICCRRHMLTHVDLIDAI